MLAQIRHLQSREPFETFSIELANGRVIQIYDHYQVATTEGAHHGVVGVLHEGGTFEVLNAGQIVSVSVGVHPQVKQQLEERRAEMRKTFGVSETSRTSTRVKARSSGVIHAPGSHLGWLTTKRSRPLSAEAPVVSMGTNGQRAQTPPARGHPADGGGPSGRSRQSTRRNLSTPNSKNEPPSRNPLLG